MVHPNETYQVTSADFEATRTTFGTVAAKEAANRIHRGDELVVLHGIHGAAPLGGDFLAEWLTDVYPDYMGLG